MLHQLSRVHGSCLESTAVRRSDSSRVDLRSRDSESNIVLLLLRERLVKLLLAIALMLIVVSNS